LDWLQERDAQLFEHMHDWLARLQALLDNAVDGKNSARFPQKETAPGQKFNYAYDRYKETGESIDQVLKDSDQKLFDLLEDWLSRFQLFFLDGQNFVDHDHNGGSHDHGTQSRNTKDEAYTSEAGTTKQSHVQSFHGLRHLHQSSTGSSMHLATMFNEEDEEATVSCRQACMDLDRSKPTEPVPALPFQWQRSMHPYVFSWMFEAFFGCVIISNSVFLGIQVQVSSLSPGAEPHEAIFVVASIYTILFTVEWVLRLSVGGITFLKNDWAWLILDTVVVASSLLEFVLEIVLRTEDQNATKNVSTSMRIVRILRVAKITRAIRVVRLVKFIRSLKTLLYCIGRTLRAMAWSGVLLVMIIFLFSLIFTDICTEFRVDVGTDPIIRELLQRRFGSLDLSMHTLFAAITGGLTWVEVSDALAVVSPIWQLLFEVYIAFSLFAVLNVMTGVFCQSAIESAERDHELILQNVAHEKAKYFRAVRRLFAQLDRNGDGGVSIKEFKQAMKDPALHAVFDALEISAGDAWALFTQLDRDGDAEVNVDEFLEGCMLLKGPARSIDVISIKRDLTKLQERMDTYMTDVGEVKRIVSRPLRITR